MEHNKDNLAEHSAARTSNTLSLAVAIGLITFFVAEAWAGGLTGIQGFFIGLSAIVFIYILSQAFGKDKGSAPEQSIQALSDSGVVPVSHSEGEGGIVITVYVNKNLVGSRKVDNV